MGGHGRPAIADRFARGEFAIWFRTSDEKSGAGRGVGGVPAMQREFRHDLEDAVHRPAIADDLRKGLLREALKLADDAATAASPTKATSKEDIEKQSRAFHGSMETFLADVNFGVGRVWRQGNPPMGGGAFLYEFLGSLLTGVLVSVGAPCWHDLLRTLSNLRKSGS